MKVLKDNYNKTNIVSMPTAPYPRHLTCEWCNSDLEYNKEDLRMGAMGCNYIDCPLCGGDNLLDDNENNIDLTFDNIEFPTHFWHSSKETGAVDICNTDEIRKELNRAKEYFRMYKDEFDWHVQCGNLSIHVHRYSGDEIYDITLSNDFYTTEIPFEREDY